MSATDRTLALQASFSITESCAKRFMQCGSIRQRDLRPDLRASVVATTEYVPRAPQTSTTVLQIAKAKVKRDEEHDKQMQRLGALQYADYTRSTLLASGILFVYVHVLSVSMTCLLLYHLASFSYYTRHFVPVGSI